MNKQILVIGGTGMLGYPVAKALKTAGYEVTIFTRDIKRARLVLDENFDFAEGDIFNSQSLKNAMKDKFAVHINLQGGPALKDFERTEGQGTLKIVLAAKETGIQYLTSISGASVDEKNTWFPVIKAKYAAENYIKTSGIPYTIFRPTWFMESLPLFVRGKKASVIGNNPHKYNWVTAGDYAQMVADAYTHQAAENKTVFVYGPEKYTPLEALERYCAVKYPEIKPAIIPLGAMKTIAFLTMNKQLKLVSALMGYFIKTSEKEYSLPNELKLAEPKTTIIEWAKNS